MTENKLEIVISQSGLEESKAKTVLQSFSQFFEQAEEWEQKAKAIVVTDKLQVSEMQQAREIRLTLKDIRVNAEKTRKELKEQSLRESRAIDGIANVIKALIEPLEEHLEKQEKFAEIQLAIELENRNNQRILELTPYVPDISVYQLREMSDESFTTLLNTAKTAFEAQREAERKAEEERIAKEEADKKARAQMEADNKKLREDAIKREQEIENQRQIDLAKREQENKERIAKETKEREAREEKEKAERIVREEKERKDAEEKQKLEEELKSQAIKISKEEDLYFVRYGEAPMGVVGSGDSIENAITDFCKKWIAGSVQ